jgi:hypothetical protein
MPVNLIVRSVSPARSDQKVCVNASMICLKFLPNDFLAIFLDLPALTFDIELSSFPGVFLYVICPKNKVNGSELDTV